MTARTLASFATVFSALLPLALLSSVLAPHAEASVRRVIVAEDFGHEL